jgi:importin subunit alpha-1
MTDGPDEQIELALKAGVLPRVVKLLDSEESSMLAPALRVLGNFVTGNDALTQVRWRTTRNHAH